MQLVLSLQQNLRGTSHCRAASGQAEATHVPAKGSSEHHHGHVFGRRRKRVALASTKRVTHVTWTSHHSGSVPSSGKAPGTRTRWDVIELCLFQETTSHARG
jgi:hypothetical protein